MSKKIKSGNLVCMFRRKTPGIGIVLQREADLEEYCGIEKDILLKHTVQDRYIDTRQSLCWWYEIEEAIKNSTHPTIAKIYVSHNHFGKKKTLKNDFCYVRWFKRPSDYSMMEVYGDSDWYPTDWLRCI